MAVSTEAISESRPEIEKFGDDLELARITFCLLLSPISRLCRTLTPWMQDSNTCAPCWPNWLPFKSRCNPAVDSLHARPNRRCFNASNGILQLAMFKCFKLKLLVKNCLNDGGISFPFFVPKELWATLRCERCVEHPLSRAPNSYVKKDFIWLCQK